jgi:hypothetical protein
MIVHEVAPVKSHSTRMHREEERRRRGAKHRRESQSQRDQECALEEGVADWGPRQHHGCCAVGLAALFGCGRAAHHPYKTGRASDLARVPRSTGVDLCGTAVQVCWSSALSNLQPVWGGCKRQRKRQRLSKQAALWQTRGLCPAHLIIMAFPCSDVGGQVALTPSVSTAVFSASNRTRGQREMCRFRVRCKRPDCWHAHLEGRHIDIEPELAMCCLGTECRKLHCFFGHPPGRTDSRTVTGISPQSPRPQSPQWAPSTSPAQPTEWAPATPPPADEGATTAAKQLQPDNSSQNDSTIFIGNLPCDITEEDLTIVVAAVGDVKDVRIPIPRDKHSKVRYGFVEFSDPRHADLAVDVLHKTELLDRRVRVERCHSTLTGPSNRHGGRGGDRTRSRTRGPKPSMAPHVAAMKNASAQPGLPRPALVGHLFPLPMLPILPIFATSSLQPPLSHYMT